MDLSTHPLTTKRHPKGFVQLDPLPSEQDLKDYYTRVYFQENKGQYETDYNDEEKAWFRLEGRIADHVDEFDFRAWAKQALGPSGHLVALLPPLRSKAREKALAQLASFRMEETGSSV